jgi:hypothetical protein
MQMPPPQMAPPPPPPVDPLAAAGAHELAAFIASLPPAHVVAYLPVPSVEAVLVALLRAEPDASAGIGAAVMAQLLPQQHGGAGAGGGMQQQQGGPPPQKRRAEEAGFAVPGGAEELDVFRQRMRARGV